MILFTEVHIPLGSLTCCVDKAYRIWSLSSSRSLNYNCFPSWATAYYICMLLYVSVSACCIVSVDNCMFQVTEVRRYSTFKDMDFIKYGSQITVDWANKFVDASTSLAKFQLYISTQPGGMESCCMKFNRISGFYHP